MVSLVVGLIGGGRQGLTHCPPSGLNDVCAFPSYRFSAYRPRRSVPFHWLARTAGNKCWKRPLIEYQHLARLISPQLIRLQLLMHRFRAGGINRHVGKVSRYGVRVV